MQALFITAAAIGLIVLLSATVNAWVQIRAAGPEETAELMKVGVSLRRLREGNMPAPDSGSLVTVREGLKMKIGEDGKPVVEQTRTLSRDMC